MRGTFYHGTTDENLPGIARAGLRKGSWVSPDRSTAEHFAASRAGWNGRRPVVLVCRGRVGLVRGDRQGRAECQLKEVTQATEV